MVIEVNWGSGAGGPSIASPLPDIGSPSPLSATSGGVAVRVYGTFKIKEQEVPTERFPDLKCVGLIAARRGICIRNRRRHVQRLGKA